MNPKNIRGINKVDLLEILKPTKLTCYCSCKNCNATWQYEFEAYAVTGSMTRKQYDFCTECFKDESS